MAELGVPCNLENLDFNRAITIPPQISAAYIFHSYVINSAGLDCSLYAKTEKASFTHGKAKKGDLRHDIFMVFRFLVAGFFLLWM